MTEPIVVLHVMNEFADGSISRIVERIIQLSDHDRYQWHVGVVKPNGNYTSIYKKLDAKVICFFNSSENKKPIHKNINEYIDTHQVQIVHSHTPRTIIEVWKSLQKKRTKDVTHLATKHLLTRPGDRKYGLLFTLIDILSLYLPDHMVAVSNTMANKIKSYPAIDKDKIISIPNGIPCSEYDQPHLRVIGRKELGISDEEILFGFNGRISRVKRLDDLIYAFSEVHKHYPKTRLVFAGEGELRETLELLTKSLNISDSVIWLGFYSQIPKLLASIDIYIQTSANEGLSLSILEAMSAGKPVITTRVDSACEIIEDGYSGIIIPVGSISAIENALIHIIENPQKGQLLANNGKTSVFQRYNIQNMVSNYLNVYQCLSVGKRP